MDCETSQQKNEPEEQVAQAFLDNYNILREENEKLKQNNQVMQAEVYTLSEELKKLQLVNKNAEVDLLKEKESHKEAIWNLRNDMQKLNEERLKWKEKYLDVCMKKKDNETVAKPNNKELLDNAITDNMPEDLYANLSSAFDLGAPEDQQTVSVIVVERRKRGNTDLSYSVHKKTFNSLDAAKKLLSQSSCDFLPANKSSKSSEVQPTDHSYTKVNDREETKEKEGEETKENVQENTQVNKKDDAKVCFKVTQKEGQQLTFEEYVVTSDGSLQKEFNGYSDSTPTVEIEKLAPVSKKLEVALSKLPLTYQSKLNKCIVRIETPDQPRRYMCVVCDKTFSTKACTRRHVATHLDERPFACHMCGQAFKVKVYLDSHIHNKHRNEKLKCRSCPAQFKWKSALDSHRKRSGCGKEKIEETVVTTALE